MSKYSSDSDSSSGHRKSRHSRRSSSSSSSNSSHRHKSKKTSKRHSSSQHKKSKSYSSRGRRRSRSHSRTTSRHSRSQSKDRHRRRSRSRDKYKHKYHHKSRSHSKGHSSRYQSRSSSNDTHSRQSRSPHRSNSSSGSSPKRVVPGTVTATASNEDQLREKLLKAIKAAEVADHQLKQQGVLPKGVKSRNDLSLASVKPQGDIIKDINAESFVQRTFTSTKNNRNSTNDDCDVEHDSAVPNSVAVDVNSIFHSSFFVDPKGKLDRWVKKLYLIRQRAVSGEPLSS